MPSVRACGAVTLAAMAALLLSACADRVERPWTESAPTRTPVPTERLPDLPDAFRAELRGGQAPGCPLRGNAVYLGGGRFLTAAHLVDGIVPRLRHCAGTPIPTTIRYAGRVLAVQPLRVGEGYLEPGVGPLYKGGEDLALLQASASPPGPAARPCGAGPLPGQAVRISSSSQQGLAKAGSMVPEVRKADGAYADIALPMAEGESGAGVFDPETNCLLGIVSHRPDSTPDHSRIVPAATIRAFLGTEGVAELSGPRGLRPPAPPPGG
ncbi:trypsin-like peptidase domain-containing protein [Pararoseomonas indoligenes]|uniref:Trypsin-like peptidase domain-containing protein n=1 Tax=Roseomonas indoligenes TaxID=2820811 RepID=A0A940MXT1_9PROT|nr:trypsin-like peptidase domain-containing protein [Pararoseomonas indoligenes]MBP0494076.1 trypsin-like peptidase domain-containing protein [Pararoseomonas indoligenes]